MKSKSLRVLLALTLTFCLLMQTGIMTGAQGKGESTFMINCLKTEYTDNPIGIDVTAPRFSWQMVSTARSQSQSAYQIMVSSTAEKLAAGNYDIWDSSKTLWDSSIGIVYNGKTLEPTSKYYWNVRVWNQSGMMVESSETATFETGLLGTGWGSAQYLKGSESPTIETLSNYTINFDFKIESDSLGFYFGATKADSKCMMWQVNTFDFPGETRLRPHRWGYGGSRVISEPDITAVIPVNKQHDWHHMTIEVTDAKNNTSKIITKINGTKVDENTMLDNQRVYLNKIGFRQTEDSEVHESGWFDNIVITSSDGLTTYFSDSFSGDVNLKFPDGTITPDGTLYVAPGKKFLQNDYTLESSPSAPMFRKEFSLDSGKVVKSARVYATARGIYDLYLNGKQVGEDYFNPGWTDYRVRFMYQTFDVTDMLKDDNAIGAVVGNGWLFGNLSIVGKGTYTSENIGPKGILAKVVIQYTDGTSQVINTDGTWKYYGNGPVIEDDFFDGETYDARKEVPGWHTASFDDSSWKAAETAQANPKLITAQIGPTVRIDNDVECSVVGTIKPDVPVNDPSYGVTIYDLGQNIAGNVKVKLEGPAGTVVKMRFGEMIDVNKGNTLYIENLIGAKATDYYTLKGTPGGEWYTPRFTFHGFRYFEVSANIVPPSPEDIKGIVLTSTIDQISTFESSNQLVNQLYSNIVWSQRDNFLSIPTDCPQRAERMGWAGDAQIFARTSTYNMDTNQFFEKWMQDVRDSQLSNGSITNVSPHVHTGDGTNGWGDAVVIVPWQMYQQYNNVGILKDNYAAMKKWVAYLAANSTNYIRPNSGFGDWLPVVSTSKQLTNTAFTAYANLLLSKIAVILEQDADAIVYQNQYQSIKTAWQNRFINEDGTLTENTQTAYALAIMADLIPAEKMDNAATAFVNNIRDNGWHLTTGFMGTGNLAQMLSKIGRDDVAFRLLEQTGYPSWLYSVVNGATTIWETWDCYIAETGVFRDPNYGSFNHYSFGAIQEWMMRNMAGIERDETDPGYKKFILQPTFGGTFTYANTSWESAFGTIVSNWSLEGNTFKYDCTVPANTTAMLRLPTALTGSITESGIAVAGSSDITFVETKDGRSVYTVGSGSYHFEMQIDRNSAAKYNLTVKNADGISGKATVDGNAFDLPVKGVFSGGHKTIEATSNNEDYAFSHWTGDVIGKINPTGFSMVKDLVMTANFKYIGGTSDNDTTTLRLNAGDGSFLINGKSETSPYTGTFEKGAEVVIDVIAPAGKVITGWSGTPIKGNPAVVVMNGNIDATVTYQSTNSNINLAFGKTASSNDALNSSSWKISYITDGVKTGTGYSSRNTYGTGDLGMSGPYVEIDLGSNTSFNTVKMYPRSDDESILYNAHYFPVNSVISVRAEGGSGYTVVHTSTDNPNVATPHTFKFNEVTARYVRFTATKLSPFLGDDVLNRFQLAEMEIYNASESDGTLSDIEITQADSINQIKVGEELTLSNNSEKEVTWYIHKTTGDTFGILSDCAAGMADGKSVTITGLAEGIVDVVARAKDGTAIGSYRVAIGSNTPKVKAVIVDKDGNPIENPSFETNAPITVSIITPDDVYHVKTVNENGLSIGKTVIDVVDNGDGTKTWTVEFSVATAGNDRRLSVYTAGKDHEYSDSGFGFKFDIVNVEAKIISIQKNTSASVLVNEEFTVTVVGSKVIDKIKLVNESGSSIGIINKEMVINGNNKIWTLTIKIGSSGVDRRITALGAPKGEDYLQEGASFTCTVIKAPK